MWSALSFMNVAEAAAGSVPDIIYPAEHFLGIDEVFNPNGMKEAL